MNQFAWLLLIAMVGVSACGKSTTERTAAGVDRETARDSTEGDTHDGHDEHGDAHDSGDDDAGARVQLSGEQIRNAGIVLAEAGPASIRETLPLYGVIVVNAERVRDVRARYPGVIQNVNAKVGDTVRKGQALAVVESNESLQNYPIVAPLAGAVTARNANAGEQSGDKTLFTVADLSTVWVEVALFPRDVGKVRVGQAVHVRSAGGEARADGTVVYVAPLGNSANQTLTARVQLDNADRRWAPGLYVIAEADLAHRDVPLAVDAGALQTVDGKAVVFVRTDEGFELRPVRTGHADSERSEIVTGLEPGETYVAANSFVLKAELGKGTAEHEH
jgi:membrane fusion protein, heavy metal efflux system